MLINPINYSEHLTTRSSTSCDHRRSKWEVEVDVNEIYDPVIWFDEFIKSSAFEAAWNRIAERRRQEWDNRCWLHLSFHFSHGGVNLAWTRAKSIWCNLNEGIENRRASKVARVRFLLLKQPNCLAVEPIVRQEGTALYIIMSLWDFADTVNVLHQLARNYRPLI